MTTIGPNERTIYPLEGQVYYVPDQSASGRTALNRLINSDLTDHADAIGSLSGYSQDMVLGFPWTSASVSGVVPLLESFDSSTGDHALQAPSESLPGYSPQPLAAYGYPRYGNAAEVLLTLSTGGVTVQSNAVAGGALWRWYWNGTQFVNHFDYGREIQGAFFFKSDQLNPTEAGDEFTSPYSLDQSLKHGSPVLQFQNQENAQITRAIPLQWDPTLFGGDQDHPAIWGSLVLGKDLTLNFNSLGSVAKYTTHLVLPVSSSGTLQMPASFLNSNFNRYWTYDAQSKQLTEVTSVIPNGCACANGSCFAGYSFTVNFGGVIMSDVSGANAMGAYGVDPSDGGSVSYFAMFQFFCWGDGPSESANDTTDWTAVRGNNVPFPAGESTYNVYVITDSVQNVRARMDDLYSLGVR